MANMPKHVLRSQAFDRPTLDGLFKEADSMRDLYKDQGGRFHLAKFLAGRLMYTIFYEASTRTRISFETAGIRLGMHLVSTESADQFSSAVKGETLEDSMKVLCGYGPDVVVLRHPETGAAEKAATIADKYGVSVINAGDGKGQHPTQALLDLYTISHHFGGVDGKIVVIGGDLANGRTARSLSYLLSKYQNVRIVFVSPHELMIGEDILAHLDEHKVPYVLISEAGGMQEVLREADVVYWTRVQSERMKNTEEMLRVSRTFQIDQEKVAIMKPGSIIMHPLPRIWEISKSVDDDPRAKYFEQAHNGLYVRMAILTSLFRSE